MSSRGLLTAVLAIVLPASGRHRPRPAPPQPRPADAQTLRLPLRQELQNAESVGLVRPYVRLNPQESP